MNRITFSLARTVYATACSSARHFVGDDFKIGVRRLASQISNNYVSMHQDYNYDNDLSISLIRKRNE